MTTIHIRTDTEIKEQASAIFNLLGLNMNCAINIFLRQVIAQRGFPFPVKLNKDNMEEAMNLAKANCKTSTGLMAEGYRNAQEVMNEVLGDEGEDENYN